MSSTAGLLLAAGIAYLLGGIPSGLWIGRMARGVDVRQHGSGNLGATNVYRTLGPRLGLTVLLLDAAKGVAAVLIARALVPSQPLASGLIGMVGSFFGHMFTPFAGFRGGKGVATAAGAWAALVPFGLLTALVTWIVLFATTRLVSLASVCASIVLPIAVWGFGHRSPADPFLWLSILTAVFIVVRHRSNLGRLKRGEESRLAVRGSTDGGSKSTPPVGAPKSTPPVGAPPQGRKGS